MFILSHAGHWTTSIIYIVPILLIAAALFWSNRRNRSSAETVALGKTPGGESASEDRLQELAERHLSGGISDEEYECQRRQILD